MKSLIQKLVKEAFDELRSKNITIYFDMDGVLADFEGSVHKDSRVVQAENILNDLLRQSPELANLHNDELRAALRGPQEDPLRKKIKKAFNQYRELSFAVAGRPGHFANLDMLPGAREMLKVANKLSGKLPHILTAPMDSNPRCEEEKFSWVNKNLNGLFDGFHCTQDKDHFAHSKFDILIDDRPKYVNKFRAAGGTAILHTSPTKSMKELEEIVESLKLDSNSEISEARRPVFKANKGLMFTRYGGLTPRKQDNASAPVNKGLWAFIYPHFDSWFIGGAFSDIEGRFTKDKKLNKNLLKHFFYSGPVFTRFHVPNSIEHESWYLTNTDELAKYLPKLFARDVADARQGQTSSVYHSVKDDELITTVKRVQDIDPEYDRKITKDPYKYGHRSVDHYEVFIPTRGSMQSFSTQNDKEKGRELDEFNAMGTGAVVGYTLPLGMKPDYDKLGTSDQKKKRPHRWYDVTKEEYIGSKGGVSYFQIGGSLPDKLYNLDKDGKPTRDPGVPGLSKKKRKRKKTK